MPDRLVQVSSSATMVRDIARLFRTMDSFGRFVTLEVENARRGLRYVQAILSTDGWIYLESVSDEYLEGVGELLSPAEVGALVRLGLDRPDPEECPNWSFCLGPEVPGRIPMLAELAMKTFVDVHDWRPGEQMGAVLGECSGDGEVEAAEAS